MGRISKLHEYTLDRINSKFPHLKARENYYPDWLTSTNGTRLELDIYIDDLKIAAEIQGSQHSYFVPFFHVTKENFEKQKQYDDHKKIVCRSEGVRLYDIATEQDADIMIYEINEILQDLENKKPKYFYQDDDSNEAHGRASKKSIHKIKSMKNVIKNKLERKNDTEEVAKRLNRARDNLEKYKTGQIEATEEKALFWELIIKRNGIMDIEDEYKLAVEAAIKRASS